MVDQGSVSILEAVVLGVVQGVTEFLPISSTAHLRVVPAALGWHDPGVAYSAVIQLGSVIALLCFFAKDILSIAAGSARAVAARDFAATDFRLAASVVVGTIPICVIGLAAKSFLEQPDGPLRSLPVIGAAAISMGVLLFLAEKIAKRERGLDEITGKDGLLVGLGQAMALIPGCSRSGSTLTVALFLNMKRADAARYSFLLGIPATVLSGLLELKEMVEHGLGDAAMSGLIVGLLVSAVVSYGAIWWMIRFLQSHSTGIFIVYRLVFGTAVILASTMGWVKP